MNNIVLKNNWTSLLIYGGSLVPSAGQVTLLMEDLRTITNVGTKAPVYILCLSELKRLEHVRGTRNNSLYKVNVQY